MAPWLMNRCPRVAAPDWMPSTMPGTTRLPCSMTSPCTGRTNCASPSPQRMSFATGSFSIASPTIEPSAPSRVAPLDATRAAYTFPFGVSRCSSASGASPCFFANPATAWAGALTDGPLTSRSESSALSSTSGTTTAIRRGVASAFCAGRTGLARRRLATSPAWTASSNAPARLSRDRGGSSSVSNSTSSVARSGMGHWKPEALARFVVRLRDRARECANAADVGSALGHRDRAARVEQVERVRALQHHLVGRQRTARFHEPLRLFLKTREEIKKQIGVRQFEVVARLLDLVLVKHVAIGHSGGPQQVVHAFLALQVHGQALQAIGNLAQHRLAGEAADLLEVGELGDLHAVEPHFPAQAPSAERRRFPVVLDAADVVLARRGAEALQRIEVQRLDLERRRLEHHLVLVVVLQAVGIFAVAPVFRAARGLHISRFPQLPADGAQESGGVERAGADLHVVGLQQHASLAVPEGVELRDELLEGQHAGPRFYRLAARRATSTQNETTSTESTTINQSRYRAYGV